MNFNFKNTTIYLLLITFVGILLRIYQIGKQSLWLDEVFTMHVSQLSPYEIWKFTVSSFDVHPPLFYWLEHISISFLGLTPLGLRIFPAVFGILTIPVFYVIGKDLYNENLGLLLSIFIAISPFHIFHSQDARMYTLFLLLFSVSVLFLIKYIKTKKTIFFITSALILAATCYVHFLSFVLSSIFIYTILLVLCLENKSLIKNTFTHLCICVISILPLIPTMVTTIFLNPSNPFYIDSGRNIVYTGIDMIIRTTTQMSGSSIPLSLGLYFLMIYGAYAMLPTVKNSIIPKITLFPPAVITIISIPLSYKMQLEPRYFIFLLLPLFLIISYGVYELYNGMKTRYTRLNKKIITTALVIIIILLHTPAIYFHYTANTKPDWSGLSGEISSISNTTHIVLIPGGNQKLFELYYTKPAIYINTPDELYAIKSTENTLFVIPGDIKHDKYRNEYIEWITNNTTIVKKYDVFEIRRGN